MNFRSKITIFILAALFSIFNFGSLAFAAKGHNQPAKD